MLRLSAITTDRARRPRGRCCSAAYATSPVSHARGRRYPDAPSSASRRAGETSGRRAWTYGAPRGWSAPSRSLLVSRGEESRYSTRYAPPPTLRTTAHRPGYSEVSCSDPLSYGRTCESSAHEGNARVGRAVLQVGVERVLAGVIHDRREARNDVTGAILDVRIGNIPTTVTHTGSHVEHALILGGQDEGRGYDDRTENDCGDDAATGARVIRRSCRAVPRDPEGARSAVFTRRSIAATAAGDGPDWSSPRRASSTVFEACRLSTIVLPQLGERSSDELLRRPLRPADHQADFTGGEPRSIAEQQALALDLW
jgi:hypothetical protein